MSLGLFIAQFIFVLNILVIAIVGYTTTYTIKEIYNIINVSTIEKTDENSYYITFSVLLLCLGFSITMFFVNIPSAINHYIVYFDKRLIRDSTATWLRFIDRYAMVFLAVLNDLRVQKFIVKSLIKYIKHKHEVKINSHEI